VSALILHLHRLRYRLGIAGLAGLAVGVAGLALTLLVVLPAERQAQLSAEKLQHLRLQPKTSVVEPVIKGDSAALAEFYAQFPAMHELPDQLKTLNDLARKHEIKLEHGEFKISSIDGEKLLSYEITLPVKCSYPHLRSFIEAAAVKLPTLGLSSINLKREAVGDNLVQAKLDFILYLSEN
jgi:hypothetical protein